MTLIKVLFLFFAFSSQAHEGSHGPKSKLAPHGGILRDSESLMLELVKDKSHSIKIYPLQHDGKAIKFSEMKIDFSKSSLKDNKGKSVEFKLIESGDHWILNHSAQNARRLALEIFIEYEKMNNRAKWQIELMGN